MSTPSLKIDWASHEAAATACRRWHYSRTMPVPPNVRCGVWESGEYIGAVIFGRGANKSLGSPYGLAQTECCELVRVALRAHVAPVSRIIRLSLAFLLKNSPGMRLVVSYADPNQGHLGGIYQAGNWIYCGQTAESFEYISANGKRWHPRQLSPTGVKVQFGTLRHTPKTTDCKKVARLGKHRYLMPLDAQMRTQLLPLSQPYPKRPKQAMGSTTATATG